MAITPAELELVRNELDARITAVTVEHVSMAQAIGSYSERFTALDARFDAMDSRIDAVELRLDFVVQDMERRFTEVDRRFDGVDRRLDALDRRMERLEDRMVTLDRKIDLRFGWQTFLMAGLAVLVLFDDAITTALGL